MSRFVLTAQLQLQAPNNVAQVVRQIQSQLNGVTVNVQVQGAPQAQRQIQQIANQTNQAASAAERMGKAFAVSVRRFAAFSIATRAVGLFTSTLSDAVQTAIDFERQMVKVSQVTGDSLAKLRGLTKTITGLSTGLGVSSASLLEVSTVLLQAGLSAKDTEVALKSLARAALAPNFDSITETAEGAIAILAQFQEGVGSLEKQLGSINAVAGAFAVEASDLIDVIRRTGGVFKASGGSLNELLALFTSVRATTRESAESIGTGLRTIFTRIQRPKTIEFLKQFGVELVDLEGKFVGPFEAVKRLSAALSGLGEGDITFIRIAEELGGFRQIGKVLPLLQQFSTAQAALNVATKAGNSLAQDAATAQQALAIRIIKVKEEFLALVRSITETSTFQIMASTALSLASALIRISEAIKPLLPLLGALAAFKIAKGFGTFVGSVAGGLQSGRTFNQGGRVHKFARGGMVPGTGNRDTVPAMLQPGEFVIRKSSVNRLGAGTLHAMNENRYAAGGRVHSKRNFYGTLGPDGRSLVGRTKGLTLQEAVASGIDRRALSNAYGAKAVNEALGTAVQSRSAKEKIKTKKRKEAKTPTDDALKQQYPGGVFRTIPGAIGGFFLTPESGTDSPYTLSAPYPFDLNGKKAAIAPGSTISNFVPFRSDLKKNARLNNIIDNSAKRGLIDSIQSAAPKVNSFLDIAPSIDFNEQNVRGAAAKLAKDQQVVSTIGGYLFEGIIQGVTGAQLAGGRTSFDFPSVANVKDKLASMFTTSEGSLLSLLKADAKRSKNPKTNMSIVDKLRQDIQKGDLSGVMRLATGGLIKKFAVGGMASAPLVDDILANASGSILPRPSSAIASLIKAGGGAIDIDRTIKRTIGDKAYAMAKTDTAKSQVLQKFFRDETARLNDIKSSPLTSFGKELQSAIKSRQLDPKRLSIISKSLRTRGVPEYLSQLFGIPIGNMIFTGGRSKQPAMDAMRGKGPRSSRVRFATGGGVGTDTVPALLTPGEFVVNRAAAQKIGYGNLNRMNKVGKYAKGGVVQRFQTGGVATPMGAPGSLPNMSAAATSVARFVDTTDKATESQKRSIKEVVQSNKFFALSMTTSLMQGFLPSLDENSSSLTKLSHSILGLATTIASVGFALEAFGAKLNTSTVLGFLTGKGMGFGNIKQMMGGLQKAGFSPEFARSATGVAQGFAKILGPLAVTITSLYALHKVTEILVDGLFGNAKKAKEAAIQKGDVDEAGLQARKQANRETFGAGLFGGASIGAIIGSLGGPIGTAAGAAIGGTISALFFDRFADEAENTARAMASLSKAAKTFEKTQTDASIASEKFKKGSISASAYLNTFSAFAQDVSDSQKEVNKTTNQTITGKSEIGSGAILRNLGAYLGGGLFGMETASTRNKRLSEEGVAATRGLREKEAQLFDSSTEARNAVIRSAFARGGGEAEARSQVRTSLRFDESEIMGRSQELKSKAEEARKSGDVALATELDSRAEQLSAQAAQFAASLENIREEVERSKAAFEAMNLGLRPATSKADAMSASMERFAAGLEVGGDMFVANTEFLSSAMSGAAEAMNPNDLKNATESVKQNLLNMGVDPKYVQKFETNTAAFIQAQQNYTKAFDNIKAGIAANDFRQLNANELKDKFAEELTAGLGEEAKNNLTAIIKNIELSPDEVDNILGGNLQAFGDKLGEAGQKQFDEIMKIAEARRKAEQVLIDLTKQRIEAERNYIEAQKEALSIQMEARELQGKYGGTAVTNAERQANVLARANVGAGRLRLSDLSAGSTDELRRRNDEIRQRFAGLEGGRRVAGGLQGTQGVIDDATQADLEKASKDQISTIRELIKIQEDELKIIQEKNKLEKDSLDALIAGDVDKFFEQQAAVGATAAIATGNETLMQSFGAKALGAAYTDIQRQQEAGVQELYGVRLAGAGGLTERAAGASLAARGVTDPRAAQMAARTTAEEEKINANIRGLSQELADAGQVQADLAAMRLDTANINVEQAKIVLAGGETLSVGGAAAPTASGASGASGATTNAAATSAAGRAGASGAGSAGGAGGTGGAGRSGGSGGVGGTGGATGTAGVGVQDVAAAGQANNGDIFGSIRYGAGLGAAAYTYGPSAANMARGAGGQFRAGMDVAKIGLGKGGLSRLGKVGYTYQKAASGIKEGITRFGIGRGLEKAGYAATAGETVPARLGRFSVKAQNFAQNLPSNIATQYNYFKSGRELQRQGLSASTRAGKAGALLEKGVQGFQNFRTGLSRTTAPTFGSKAMAVGQRIGAIGNRLSPYASAASRIGGRVFNSVGGGRLVSGAAGLVDDFNFGRSLVGAGMGDDAFTLAQKAGVGVQRLGGKAATGIRAAGIQAQRLGLRASPMLGKAGSFAATQGRAAMIQAQRLGLRALPMAQNALSAAGTAGSNLVKGFNVGRSGLANVGGMFGQQAAKTAGSTLAGRAGLFGGQTLAKVAGSGIGKFAGGLLTKGGGLGLGTAISGITNLGEFLYDPSAYNAKMQGKSDAGLARAQTRNTAGFAYDSLAGAAEGFVDPVGKLVEAGYVMKDFTKDALAASEASAKTERMKAATVDDTGLNVQERTWAKEQAMRENQLAAAQAKGDTAGVSQAQKDLKDLEVRRIQERTANDWLPNIVSGAGIDTAEYKRYVEQQKVAQKAQEEAALQQEAQAKATAEAAAAPMSTIPSVPLVSAEQANALLNQSGVQAMQASQTQAGRASSQTLAGGTITNQAAGTTTAIEGAGGIDPEIVNKLMATLDKFNVDLSANIDKLANTNLSIKLDATNINVNLNGGDFLAKLTKDVQQAVLQEVSNKLQNASIGNDGKLKLNSGSLPGSPSAPTSSGR